MAVIIERINRRRPFISPLTHAAVHAAAAACSCCVAHCFVAHPVGQPCFPASTPCQVVREHYLRDDIYSGTPLDPTCPAEAWKLSGEAPHYLVVDTNVVLHQAGGHACRRTLPCAGQSIMLYTHLRGWAPVGSSLARISRDGSQPVLPLVAGRRRPPSPTPSPPPRWTCWSTLPSAT